MDSCKPTNLVTNDYLFYTNPNPHFPYTVVHKGKGWNFYLNADWNKTKDNCEHGWDWSSEALQTRNPLPTFVDDYPEFFI